MNHTGEQVRFFKILSQAAMTITLLLQRRKRNEVSSYSSAEHGPQAECTFPTWRAFFFKAGEVWLLAAFSSAHPPSQRSKKIAYSHTIKIRHFGPHVMHPSPLIIPSNTFFFFLFRQFGYIELENLFLMPHAAFFSSEQALILFYFFYKVYCFQMSWKVCTCANSRKPETNKQTSLDNFTIPITCGKEKSS